jgi:cytidylate kinase
MLGLSGEQKMKIIISGMAAVGKSTLARAIGKKFGLRVFSGGDMLKEIAKDFGYNSTHDDWWETEEGLEFLRERKHDQQFDKKLDEKLIKLLKEGNVVITAWTMPWLYNDDKCLKIWLKAPQEVRAERMVMRNKFAFDKALRIIKERDEHNKKLYNELYGFDLESDLTPFDLVLDTRGLASEIVESIVLQILSVMRASNRL